MKTALMLLVAVGALLATTPSASAQWNWEVGRTVDEFTDEVSLGAAEIGESRRLVLVITGGCEAPLELGVGISFAGGGIFADGAVQIRWDDGPVERAAWWDGNTSLLAQSHREAEAFLVKLTHHRRLRIRASEYPSGTVTDSFDLDGAAEAVRQVRCGG